MPNYYIYLISSLPMLHFGMPPPFTPEKFVEMCERLLPENDAAMIKSVVETKGAATRAPSAVLRQWQEFDTALRNELVKARAGRRHIDPTKYLRGDKYHEPRIAHLALNALRSSSPLEGEKMLDQERWRALEELAFGHYFDQEALIIYTLKLLILERWEILRTADKTRLVEEALAAA